jgi:leader peptidase (prepilin peptidase) / N-methyltransferase
MVTSVARIGAPPMIGPTLVVSAALVCASVVRFGVGLEAIFAAYFSCVLVVLSATDLERRLLPNRIVVPSTILVLAARIALEPGRAQEWILGGLGAFAFFFVIALVYPGGLGMGDVKLAALLGVGLGAAVVPAFVIGMTAAAVFAIALLVRDGAAARKATIAYGPFLAFGALIALFVF